MTPALFALAAERLGEDAPAVLSRLGEARGHDLKSPSTALSKPLSRPLSKPPLSKIDRATLLAKARAPVPDELRLVHASWIEAALTDLPPRARTAVASPSADPIDIWLARWATAAFPPMTIVVGNMPLGPDALPWLVGVGADQLAYALGAGADHAVARVGDPLRISIARISRAPRDGQLGPRRAAIARVGDLSLDDSLVLSKLGARALAPHLASQRLAQLQLTRSLPRPIGIVVERELQASPNTSLADAPTWAALIAR